MTERISIFDAADRRAFWTIILVAVIICPSCKKQPSEQPGQGAPQSEQVGQSFKESSRTDAEFLARSRSLKDVIATARTWGPSFQSWFGKPAPEFTLTDLAGKQHRLSDYRGKDVMLIFWATWCGPCRMEIPELIQMRNTISPDKLAMLAISYISPRNSTEMVKSFVAQNNQINYTVLSVESSDLPAPYNLVNSIPCSFFIDPQGAIKLATVGLLQLSDMKAILQAE